MTLLVDAVFLQVNWSIYPIKGSYNSLSVLMTKSVMNFCKVAWKTSHHNTKNYGLIPFFPISTMAGDEEWQRERAAFYRNLCFDSFRIITWMIVLEEQNLKGQNLLVLLACNLSWIRHLNHCDEHHTKQNCNF